MASLVSQIAAAPSEEAVEHFENRFRFETDCWDVHDALTRRVADFALLDVRSPDLYSAGHIPGAINLPHGKITAGRLSAWPSETLFVVYCAGPHCNGAQRAAVRIARLGYAVKEMIGGMTGWADEGFEFADDPGSEGDQ